MLSYEDLFLAPSPTHHHATHFHPPRVGDEHPMNTTASLALVAQIANGSERNRRVEPNLWANGAFGLVTTKPAFGSYAHGAQMAPRI